MNELELLKETKDMLDKLAAINADPSNDKSIADTAEQWHSIITTKQKFLVETEHSVVFIGKVGVGKSSLISVMADLLLDKKQPKDRKTLKNNAVLAIGSGRTTVCEVEIRAAYANEPEQVRLTIVPVAKQQMQEEIEIFAQTEWHRYHKPNSKFEDDTSPTPEEIQRVIRNMTGYQKTPNKDLLRNRVVVSETSAHLTEHLIEKANLAKRTTREWWFGGDSFIELKNCFEAINQGKQENAMLPERMTLIIPNLLSNSQKTELAPVFIDTRGLDGNVEAREDLRDYLSNSGAVIVLCSAFNDAPDETMRHLLQMLCNDAELEQALTRTLIVLLDKGDAEQVNGAEENREYGKQLKIDECYRSLENDKQITKILEKRQFKTFDVLQDDPADLQNHIIQCLSSLREKVTEELEKTIKNATIFLDSIASQNEQRHILCNQVDKHIQATMRQHPLSAKPPLNDPLAGLYQAINKELYASVVYATCRRKGGYYKLNLYTAIYSRASQAATVWLRRLMQAITSQFDLLKNDQQFNLVNDHIELRQKQYEEANADLISHYARRIRGQIKKNLRRDDSIWEKTIDEWGGGLGFKQRVINHFEVWSQQKLKRKLLTAYKYPRANTYIPLLEEASQPVQAPKFTLYVHNLLALKKVEWTPQQFNILIGGNGTGKTTLLLVLKFLEVAYKRDIHEALSQVFGGIKDLKTLGCDESEPIEIMLEIGTALWSLELNLNKLSIDINEYLEDEGHEIFSRNLLERFNYGDEVIEANQKLGLRALMEKGVYESAVRNISLLFQNIRVYHDPDLWLLRYQGSDVSKDDFLHSRGTNVLTMLRKWFQDRTNRHRYQFVIEGLAAAFPNCFKELDFIEAGNVISARIYSSGQESSTRLADEANGVLQMLVLLCNVASTENGGLVAIDEPENGLHPYALQVFREYAIDWVKNHDVTLIFATHSMAFLNEQEDTPEQIFVMQTSPSDNSPIALSHLCNPDWLKNFDLGELYERSEIGSNRDERHAQN